MKINEDTPRVLWDNIKHNNIHIIGVPRRRRERERTQEYIEEIIVEIFPSMGKDIATEVQGVQ